MALNADQIEKIQLEAMLGLEPTLTGAEALRVRALLEAQIAQIAAEGMVAEIAPEWPAPPRGRSASA